MTTNKKSENERALTRREAALRDWFEEPFLGLRWSPFRLMRDGGWLFPHWWPRWLDEEISAEADWIPAIDLVEKEGSLIAKVELPGMDPKQIDVTVENGVLTIRGSKEEEEKAEERGEVVRRERRWGRFVRSMTLPAGADADKLEAEFENGVLTITVPYAAAKKQGKKIEVKTK